MSKFNHFFWYHLLKRCPACHSKLREQGYLVDVIWQSYTCPKCDYFKKRLMK